MNIEYNIENGKPIIYHYRRENGIRICHRIESFQPYFYVPEDDILPMMDGKIDNRIVRTESGFHSIINEPLKKVVCVLPKHVKELRDYFSKSFEADVGFTKRWMVDTEPSFGDEFSIFFLDIEVVDSHGFPRPEEAKETILAITCFDTLKQKYWSLVLDKERKVENRTRIGIIDKKEYPWNIKHYINENEMLEAFIDLVKFCDPDILSGWNAYKFDLEYLLKRMKNINVNYNGLSPLNRVREGSYRQGLLNKREKVKESADIAGRLFFDCLEAYARIQRRGIESYSLDNVAMRELGFGKIKTGKRVVDLTIEELLEYNSMDVELTKEIEVKRKVISYFWGMADFIKCNITDTKSFSRMTDTFMLRKKGNMVFPSVKITQSETFKGATVFDPPKGQFENVMVFDLTSLYPSIIMSMNTSVETVCTAEEADVRIPELGIYFTNKKEGFIPKVMRDLFDERDKYRKILESGLYKRGTDEWTLAWNKSEYVKQMANSIYGLFSYKGFRLYVMKLSEMTTYMGRKTLEWTKRIAEENGYKVIAGDSVHKNTKILVSGKETTIEEFWNYLRNVKNTDRSDKEEKDISEYKFETLALEEKSEKKHMYCQVKSNINKIIRHKVKKEMYEITTESGKKVIVTDNHSIPIFDGIKTVLKNSSDIKIGDMLYVRTKCGQKKGVDLAYMRNKVINRSGSKSNKKNSINTKNYIDDHDIWNRGKSPSEWMSKEGYEKWMKTKSEKSCFRTLGLNRNGSETKGMTRSEMEVDNILKNEGFEYNKSFGTGKDGWTLWNTGMFTPDFVNEELKIIIEIDGKSHNDPNRIDRDTRKDKFFNQLGYKVFRIKDDENMIKNLGDLLCQLKEKK